MVSLFSLYNLLQQGKSQKSNILTTFNKINNSFESNEAIDKSNANFIFIGGHARSGTTLMRAILDVHPNIKCGPETKILPSFVDFVATWKTKVSEAELRMAGLEKNMVDNAITDFVQNIMLNRGLKSTRKCAKDPDIIKHMQYLHSIFPKAKFIYMIRDGRAAAYSLIQQVREQQTSDMYSLYLKNWYFFNRDVNKQCKKIGKEFCLAIKYEDLVLRPEHTLKAVVNFLNETWNDKLLKHQDFIDNITISKSEWSSHQIVKPINTKSLTQWVGKIPINEEKTSFINPLLSIFNYSTDALKLNYNENQADQIVVKNNEIINKNRDFWDNRGKSYSDHILKLENFNKKIFMN